MQSGVGQLRLGYHPGSRQNQHPVIVGARAGFPQQRRFAHAGFAAQHQGAAAAGQVINQLSNH